MCRSCGTRPKAFLRSFTADYSIVSNSNEAQTDIEVWLATGRDQVQVLKKLIESDFTPHQKVNVNLKLVQASVLLPSTATGRNPDVYLQAASGDAVNYAMRGALGGSQRLQRLPGCGETLPSQARLSL